jgi:type IV pilus assembly protein PilP
LKRFFWIGLPLTVALALASAAGCGGDEVIGPGTRATGAAPPPPQGQQAPAAAGAPDAGADGAAAPSPTANMPPLPPREFREADFIESVQNRDPFRSFAVEFLKQAKSRVVLQRKVLVDRYALEELKLVGIVTRAPARALLSDPSGYGWVAKVGDFIGKPEIVHAGGPTGTDVAINWRIDRIREGDVVFIREDPSHPEIPPATRVLALRTEEPKGQGKPENP